MIFSDGSYEITDQELTQRFDPEKILLIQKFRPDDIISAIYYDKEKAQFSVKRFKIETTTLHNKFTFIKEGADNYLEAVTTDPEPVLAMRTGRGAQVNNAKIKIAKVVEVMGWKALGAKLTDFSKSVEMEWVKKEDKDDMQVKLF